MSEPGANLPASLNAPSSERPKRHVDSDATHPAPTIGRIVLVSYASRKVVPAIVSAVHDGHPHRITATCFDPDGLRILEAVDFGTDATMADQPRRGSLWYWPPRT